MTSPLPLSSQKRKMVAGELYDASDPQLVEERKKARLLCSRYNQTLDNDEQTAKSHLSELLGSMGENCFITPQFRCDYGYNIHVGEHFYSNFDLIILDVCPVKIGDQCLIGPRVSILTATHPVDPTERAKGLELGAPIKIGDNVWIGAHAVINPGVTIGDNVVIGSGAVVTKDIPSNTICGGVPAKILKNVHNARSQL